jgi:hypothetical protein
MCHNAIPSKVTDLLIEAERVAYDLETDGPPLGISISAEEFRRILDKARQTQTAWSAARSAKLSAQSRISAVDEALTSWLSKARLVVMLARGSKWSEGWIETGFAHHATNVPRRMELRITLARRLVIFLALHPDFAVPFAEVTAACGRPIYERMIQTRAALELATRDCVENKRKREAAVGALRSAMRQLRMPDRYRQPIPAESTGSIMLGSQVHSGYLQTAAA